MSDLTYFKVHLDTKPILEDLTLEEVGKIFLAMYDFAETGKVPEFPKGTVLKVAGTSMISTIDRAKRKYKKRLSPEERSKINSENGKKGGAPKGNQNAKKKTATDQKADQETIKEPKIKQNPPDPECCDYIKTMFSSMQDILKDEYDTNLFKMMEWLDVIEFLALCYLSDCTPLDPFNSIYQKGVLGFFADFKRFSTPKKFLSNFEKDAKQYYLGEYEDHTIDSYNKDRYEAMNVASEVVEAEAGQQPKYNRIFACFG